MPTLPPASLQWAVCNAPDPYWTQSTMDLLTTSLEQPSTVPKDSIPFLWHPWFRIRQFDQDLSAAAGHGSALPSKLNLKLNLLIARDVEPLGADDGAFNLWISEGVPGSPAIQSAIRIYGDSTLYERCFSFWKGLVAEPPMTAFATSHTYSNLHDHQLWFFPDPDASEGGHASNLLQPLITGIQQTHQPVKLRLVLSGIDACHRPFIDHLLGLQATAEADIKIILADSDRVSQQAISRIQKLHQGTCRLWTGGDSLHTLPMASRFMLIDGPYVERENEPAAPARLCFFFGDDLIQAQQRKQVALWSRVDNKRVFNLAEQHWERLWAMSDTLDMARPHRFRRAPNCKPPRP